jgi:hypothetical protein
MFKPVPSDDTSLIEFKKKYDLDKYDFVVLWNNRNIRRKSPGDVILAFNEFAETNQDKKVCLFIHSEQVSEHGTDIPEVIKWNGKFGDYKFTNGPMTTQELNLYYNSGDIILNIGSNEGFGLASCEALRAGTPIIVNVTGGLQDQCGFELFGKQITAEDYVEIGSLHNHREWSNSDDISYGVWAFPVWPSNRSLQGSPMTPYIFDDRCDFHDVANALNLTFSYGRDRLEIYGQRGHEWVVGDGDMASETMGDKFIEAFEDCFQNWKPRKRFDIYKA